MVHSNCRDNKEKIEIKEITCNLEVKPNSIKNDEALADSGTTDHFLKEGAPADNVKPNPNPICKY